MNDDPRLAQLANKVEEAALIKQMCSQPGFKVLQSKFDEKIKKATAVLLDMSTSDEDVTKIRQKIHVWTEVTNMLKSLVHTGNYAAHFLSEENLEVQNAPINNGQGE